MPPLQHSRPFGICEAQAVRGQRCDKALACSRAAGAEEPCSVPAVRCKPQLGKAVRRTRVQQRAEYVLARSWRAERVSNILSSWAASWANANPKRTELLQQTGGHSLVEAVVFCWVTFRMPERDCAAYHWSDFHQVHCASKRHHFGWQLQL
jgi:hypothetical protein